MSDDDGEQELDETLNPDEARRVAAQRGAIIIDIRSEEEYAEERIYGSVRRDPDDVSESLQELREDEEDPRDRALLICRDGSDSGDLAEKLREDGHTVAVIDGGMDAWTGDNLPTAPGSDEEYQGPKIKLPGAVASETEPDDEEEEGDGDGGAAESGEAEEASDDSGSAEREAEAGDADPASGEAEIDDEGDRAEARPEQTADEERAERAEDA